MTSEPMKQKGFFPAKRVYRLRGSEKSTHTHTPLPPTLSFHQLLLSDKLMMTVFFPLLVSKYVGADGPERQSTGMC